MPIRKPTEEEFTMYPTVDLTSINPWVPYESENDPGYEWMRDFDV